MLLFAAGGIACSAMTILSCDFFSVIAAAGDGGTPLDLSEISKIGIFSYQLDDSGTCRAFVDNGSTFFLPSDWMGSMWIIAQYAALFAPALGVLASLLTLTELLFGKFCGSFLIPALFYLLACASQGTVFMMYNEEDVCFHLNAAQETDTIIQNSCQLSLAAFLSIAAGFCYYVCSVLLCCLPRPIYHCCSFCSSKSDEEDGLVETSSNKGMTCADSGNISDAENPSQYANDDGYGKASAESSPHE